MRIEDTSTPGFTERFPGKEGGELHWMGQVSSVALGETDSARTQVPPLQAV